MRAPFLEETGDDLLQSPEVLADLVDRVSSIGIVSGQFDDHWGVQP
jgi:hypothetical protein